MPPPQSRPGQHSYSRILLFSMILLILLVGTAITINEYRTIRGNYEKSAASLQNQTEANLVQSIRILDAGFRLFDDSLNNEMRDGFGLVLAEYERTGGTPARMDLEGIKKTLGEGYEVYIINASGVIEYTTYAPERGLDFRTTPYFSEYLTTIRQSEGFFSDRVVNELKTGTLRKFAYMPSPDHRYIFELGFSEPFIHERRALAPYLDDLDRIARLNPYVRDMAIYDVEKHLVADYSRMADAATQRDLDAVIAGRTGITIDDPAAGTRIVYLFVDLKDARSGSDVSRIIRLTYDRAGTERELITHLTSHIIVILAAMALAVGLAYLLSLLLTRPITAMVSDVDAIAKGDLDHPMSSTAWREFRVLEESVSTMVRSLKTSLDKEKRAEEEAVRLTRQIEFILGGTKTGLDIIDAEMNVRFVDPEWKKTYGEYAGKKCYDYFMGRDCMCPGCGIPTALATKQPTVTEEVLIREGNRPVQVTTIPFRSETGEWLVAEINVDITERKRAEAALREASEQLVAGDEMLRKLYTGLESRIEERTAELKAAEESARLANRKLNLLSSVTRHDIINSLTIVLGYVRMAKQAPDPAFLADTLDKVEAAAKKIQRQIAFTKEYQNLGVQTPQWQSVSAQVKKAVPPGTTDGVRITDETTGLEVFADPLLVKVFSNLIDNAVMHGGAGLTSIRFGWHEENGGLVITCKDDGIGIPPENKELIFERGFGKNTGLGLFLCREILAITGMTLYETGVPGQGARFEIRVPAGAYRLTPPA